MPAQDDIVLHSPRPSAFSSSAVSISAAAPPVSTPSGSAAPGDTTALAGSPPSHTTDSQNAPSSDDIATPDDTENAVDSRTSFSRGNKLPAFQEDCPPLLQVPAYQGHSYVDRSYDYMRKYAPDAEGKGLDPDARVWKVYLGESESYDNDMVKGFRDTIDSLLVFAALFSAVVTSFVIETSQALEPDFAQINTSLLFEQNQLLRAAGNTTKIEAVPKSPLGPDSVTHSSGDVWVNLAFFASLALSLATALLAILVKQWLQAFTTLIPGDAKERCLIRQFRFGGLKKWKLGEIINILPLFLHLALALFLVGLCGFVYNFHLTIRYVVISIAGTAFAVYFATAVLPALWLDCPYRQPILYIPQLVSFSIRSK